MIHKTVIIDGDVVIGEGTVIGPYTHIIGPVRIGANNWIGSHVVIGSPPEMSNCNHHEYEPTMPIVIGNNNVIREFTAIQRGTERRTEIGDNCFIMEKCHIPHDAVIEDDVTMSPLVVLGGHCTVMAGATIGMSAVVHQFTVIGHCAMIAMNASVTKNIPPFSKYIPGKDLRLNDHKIESYDLSGVRDLIHGEILGQRYDAQDIRYWFDRYYDLSGESGRKEYHPA